MQQPSRIHELDGVRGTSAIMVINTHLLSDPPHGIHGAPEGKRYRSPVLRCPGKVSYTLYLVHQSVSGLPNGLGQFAGPVSRSMTLSKPPTLFDKLSRAAVS